MATQAPGSQPVAAVELIARARAGSPVALGMLYDAFSPGLFRLAYRLTGIREDAEDVVHDVFVGLPETLEGYEERGRLDAWLRRVTARVALMRLRGKARRRETRLEDTAAMPARPDGTRAGEHERFRVRVAQHEGWVIKTQHRGSDFVLEELLMSHEPGS